MAKKNNTGATEKVDEKKTTADPKKKFAAMVAEQDLFSIETTVPEAIPIRGKIVQQVLIMNARRLLRYDGEQFLLTAQGATVKQDGTLKYGRETVVTTWVDVRSAIEAFILEAHKITSELVAQVKK